MIDQCPHCGHFLDRIINDGITTCDNCLRIFDDSPSNRFMTAFWACRSRHLLDASSIKEMYNLNDEEVTILQIFGIDKCFSYDEFISAKKNNFLSS